MKKDNSEKEQYEKRTILKRKHLKMVNSGKLSTLEKEKSEKGQF